MASGDELVKYITEKVVGYIETPKEERTRGQAVKQPWTQTWFGMVPMSVSLWTGRMGRRGKRKERS